jgi:hypothetical protein
MYMKSRFLSALFPSYSCEKVLFDDKARSLAKKICPENFGRALVLSKFIVEVIAIFPVGSVIRVAVVGGYRSEPEIRALQQLGFEVEVKVFGIEDNMISFDLNIARSLSQKSTENFDLILCSQVWEHVWNHAVALDQLISLMNQGTHLWIAAPASNRAHGSPFYFSAGFTAEYFANNLSRVGLRIISYGQIGTRRNYLATHTLPTWLSISGHRMPPLSAFSEYKRQYRVLYSIRYFLKTFNLLFTSSKVTANDKYATESWVMARKN